MKLSKLLLTFAVLFFILGCDVNKTSDDNNVFAKTYSKSQTVINGSLPAIVHFKTGVNADTFYAIGGEIVIDQYDTNHRGSDALILKTDKDGNVLWSKTFRYSGTENRIYDVNELFDVLSKTDTNDIIAFSSVHPDGTATTYFPMIINIDANGNVKWKGYFYNTSGLLSIKINSAVSVDDYTYAVGYAVVNVNGNQEYKGVILKINNDTAAAEAYLYDNSSPEIKFNVVKYINNTLYVGGYDTENSIQRALLAVFNISDGEIYLNYAKEYVRFENNSYYEYSDIQGLSVDSNNIYMMFKDVTATTSFVNAVYLKTDLNGNIDKALLFGNSTYYSYFTNMFLNDGNLYIGALNHTAYIVNPENSNFEKVVNVFTGWQDYIFKNESGDVIALVHDGVYPTEAKMVKINSDEDISDCSSVFNIQDATATTDVYSTFEVNSASYGELTQYPMTQNSGAILYENVILNVQEVCHN